MLGRGPNFSASFCEWAFVNGRPNLSDVGLHLPLTDDGVRRFEPRQTFSASGAVTLRGAMDGCPPDTNQVSMKLNVNWEHASARQLKPALVNS